MIQKTYTGASGAAIAFIAGGAIFAVLVVAVKLFINIPAVDGDRGAAISKALFEIRTNEVASLNNIGWADKPRSIVRLPIGTAMQMTERNWQNPAAARADLIAREEKASLPAPKVAPKTNAAE
jgi:hypothetical protein